MLDNKNFLPLFGTFFGPLFALNLQTTVWKKKRFAKCGVKKMEILSSGSFINLENQGKIDQLKFTAGELANAAAVSEGFLNEEEAAKKLSLEFWQGLEYLSRDSEAATIQNIFLNHFLERLREIRRTTPIENAAPEIESTNESAIEAPVEAMPNETEIGTNSDDEFLGVVETSELEETEVNETNVECDQPIEPEITLAALNSPEEAIIEQDESEFVPPDKLIELVEPDESDEPEEPVEPDKPLDSRMDSPAVSLAASETGKPAAEQASVNPRVREFELPASEPYQFDKCTVKVAIQLLPVEENSPGRNAVLSVRTHDFAPQISLVELTGTNLLNSLSPALESVLASYQADLPLKVIDKMKKEKSAPKRKTTASEKKAEAKTTVSSVVPSSSQTAKSETDISSRAVTAPARQPATQTAIQGSLFG